MTTLLSPRPRPDGRGLVAPAGPPRRRWPAILAIGLVAGLTASLIAVAGIMISASPLYPTSQACDPTLMPRPDQSQLSDLTPAQLEIADEIVQTGRRMNVPARGLIVAVASAMQESRLQNLDHGHLDSLGVLQQRPSQGWGTSDQIRDVEHAAGQFYERLLDVPEWETLPVTVAANAVQRSALPGAYSQWESLAAAVVAAQAQIADISGCAGRAPEPPPSPTQPSGTAARAIDWASEQLGKPYRWGGAGPDSFDCSGLMMRAFADAGITLPRTSRDQFRAGTQIPRDQAVPGDLLFWANNPNNPATIRHVAVYLGENQILEAPRTGVPVRIRDLRDRENGLLSSAVRVTDPTGTTA